MAVGLTKLSERVRTLNISGAAAAQALETWDGSIFSPPSLEITIGNYSTSSPRNTNSSFRSEHSCCSASEVKSNPGRIREEESDSSFVSRGSSSHHSDRVARVSYHSSDSEEGSLSTEIVDGQASARPPHTCGICSALTGRRAGSRRPHRGTARRRR